MNSEIKELPIEEIISDPNQPRKSFDQIKLNELAESINQVGLLQPVLVRPLNDKFQVVHGERRWRACKLLSWKTIKAEIRDLTEKEVLEIQLVENIQREDLNPVEEAETLQRMIDEFGYTHEELGDKIGKSREYVTNKIRLLSLPRTIQEELIKGSILEGHAKAIASLEKDEQDKVVKEVIEHSLNVRDVEKLVHNLKQGNNYVPHGTSDKTFLIPISSSIYLLLEKVARKMKLKRELVTEQALRAFFKEEGFLGDD